MTKSIVVLGAVIVKDGKGLRRAGRRARASAGSGHSPAVSLSRAKTEQGLRLRREMKEEMDVEVEVLEHFMDSAGNEGNVNILLKTYKARIISGDFRLTDHDVVIWALPGDIMSYDLAKADITIAKKISEWKVKEEASDSSPSEELNPGHSGLMPKISI